MDIRTVFVDMAVGGDIALDGYELATDDGLQTAVVLSLFTDARADDDDILPPGQTERRGWWGDAYADQAGDRIGSRLWLLAASKQLALALVEAKAAAEAALAWMVEDGVAKRVEVQTFIARPEVMGMLVRINRPDGSQVPLRFDMLWSAENAV